MKTIRTLLIAAFVTGAAARVTAQSTTTTGTLAAVGDVVTVSLINVPSEVVQITGLVGSVAFEVTADNGATPWLAAPIFLQTGSSIAQPIGLNGVYVVQNVGFTTLRIRAVAIDSGTATVAATRGFAATLPSPAAAVSASPGLPLPPCNALVRTNCK